MDNPPIDAISSPSQERLTRGIACAASILEALRYGWRPQTMKGDHFTRGCVPDGFERSLRAFGRQAVGADTALVYYSGHGMEVVDKDDWFNVLAPIDADIDCETRETFRAIRKKFATDENELLKLLERWRTEAGRFCFVVALQRDWAV